MPNLEELLNPDLLAKLIREQQGPSYPYQQQGPIEAQTYNQPQTTQYGVPIVYTQPDVSLRGRLELELVFKAADLQGKTPEQIQQLSYAAVMGQNGPGIPVAKAGYLHIWQEVKQSAPAQPQTQEVSEDERRRIIGEFLAELGRGAAGDPADKTAVRGDGPTSDIGGPGYPVSGASELGSTGGRRPVGDLRVPDQHRDPEPAPDDRQQDERVTAKSASKPRYHRPRRSADSEPEVPQAELSIRTELHDY